MIKDLKYLMSYSIALFAFIGISLGGFYNYLAVVFTFVLNGKKKNVQLPVKLSVNLTGLTVMVKPRMTGL